MAPGGSPTLERPAGFVHPGGGRLDKGEAAAEKRLMLLRQALRPDLAPAADLVNAAYRGDTARLGWTHEADLLDGRRTDEASLRALLEAEPAAVLLVGAEDAAPSRLVAAALLEPGDRGVVHLGMLTVRPDRQAQGLGRSLLGGAEAEAARRGARVVRIEVISVRAELIAWYERRGYALAGRAPFPYGELTVGAPFRNDLEFVVMEKRLSRARAGPEA